MTDLAIIEFEDQAGNKLPGQHQVPLSIELIHLRQLVADTKVNLYVNGTPITTTLEEALQNQSIVIREECIRIRMVQDAPRASPALFCTSSYSGHESAVLALKFTDTGLVSAGGDGTVRFWDLGTQTQKCILKQHTHWVQCLATYQNLVASGSMDNTINLYTTDGVHIKTFRGHRDAITSLQFIDKNQLLSASRDHTVRVWDREGKITFSYAHSHPVSQALSYKDYIISCGRDQLIKVYYQFKYKTELKGHTDWINSIDMHRDTIVSGGDDNKLILWKNFKKHKEMMHKSIVSCVKIAANGVYFVSCSFDATVKAWSMESGDLICSYSHVNSVYRVMVLSDLIVSCSKDKTVKMYSFTKRRIISDLVCKDEVYCMDYNDGKLVCGGRDKKVYFFN
ncbi:Ribosome assembly protein 4 [Astathelohania contejeani]|uniref:Ribosome assembly protein 4 n=1 Tax=Astathelohania contejeani TaxID=164912 RepID=A0ABQ7HYS1_9MICR|nr:Ribosome assembly protein 4 [Thelohania contejeani]